MVLSNDDASGDTYPGNIDTLESRCREQGGTPIGPSQQTWEQDGPRNVLCVALNH